MAEQPLVSIITPSYNQAAFLDAAIQSVLSQDYPLLEYWVMDGGSTDGSVEIIKNYEDRIAGWVSEPDRGQADSINKGFKRATGDVVAWLNSDDCYRPHAIARVVELFQKHPAVGLVYSDVDSIDEEGVIFNRMTYGDWQLADLMKFNILGQPGVFFRRDVLEKAGYLDPSYHFLLDHHLWLRMAALTKLEYAQGQVWAAARIHQAAKNVAQAEGFGRDAMRIVEWMQNDERFATIYRKHTRKIWAGAYRLDAFYLLNQGKPGAALKAYWRAFWHDPATALKDWRRIGFALLTPFRPEKLRDRYLAKKKNRLSEVKDE